MLKLFPFFLLVLSINIAISQTSFLEVYNTNTRSVRDDIRIDFKDKNGNEGFLPISILKGKTNGPTFTIIAGVHGYEYPPIIAIQAILRGIDIKQLKGNLIVIPVANIASFFTRTPFINPQDQKNLNNAFPGKLNGSITEQIAHFITTNIIPVSDVFLDVHGGDACEDLIPFVCYYNNLKKPSQTALAKKLSENSGFGLVVSYPYTIKDTDPAKYTFKQAVQDGKTALSIECGKLGNVQQDNVNLIKKGVYNMLAIMDMYGTSTGPHPNIIYRNSQTYIDSNVQGIFYSKYKAGDVVKKGDIVGHTTDLFGSIIEEYKAPTSGIVLYKLATPPISVGDTVMCISSNTEN